MSTLLVLRMMPVVLLVIGVVIWEVFVGKEHEEEDHRVDDDDEYQRYQAPP